jgi:hypothetical protein
MNDPHVESLHYRFEALDPTLHDFSNAAPLDVRLADFSCRLADGRLVANPQQHHADAQSAREELEPYLEAWSAATEGSDPNGLRFRFTYVDAKTIDRASAEMQPDGGVFLHVEGLDHARALGSARLSIRYSRYPDPPPPYFDFTPDVEALLARLRGARQDPIWLLAAAYWTLTTLETLAGGRHQIPATFHISRNVVDHLGRLSSRHDPRLGRKVKGTPQPLTASEIQWLQAVLQRIVIRVGDVQGGNPSPAQITMADLPSP